MSLGWGPQNTPALVRKAKREMLEYVDFFNDKLLPATLRMNPAATADLEDCFYEMKVKQAIGSNPATSLYWASKDSLRETFQVVESAPDGKIVIPFPSASGFILFEEVVPWHILRLDETDTDGASYVCWSWKPDTGLSIQVGSRDGAGGLDVMKTCYWSDTPEFNSFLKERNIEVSFTQHGTIDVLIDADKGSFYAPFLATLFAVVEAAYESKEVRVRERAPRSKNKSKHHRKTMATTVVKWVSPTSDDSCGKTPVQSHTRGSSDKRWWCRGHLKNQPYGPHNSLRKVIYVRPYLSGHKGAPIMEKNTVEVL